MAFFKKVLDEVTAERPSRLRATLGRHRPRRCSYSEGRLSRGTEVFIDGSLDGRVNSRGGWSPSAWS